MTNQLIAKNKMSLMLTAFLTVVVFFCLPRSLAVGLMLLFILAASTFYFLLKLGFKEKKIYVLFLLVLLFHLGTTLVMYYTDFQPFSGHAGDYSTYHKSAVKISEGFRQGEFSLKNISSKYQDLFLDHYYPAIIGAIYALTLPEMIIGLLFNVWLTAISVVLVCLIILDIGESYYLEVIDRQRKNAFIVGLIAAFYPSYIFNSGLLLKDTLEVFFVILGMLFLIKTIKKFSWYKFFILYASLICATHFRFYVGYALIAAFLVCWFLLSGISIKKRLVYGLIFVVLLGFIPQISYNQGYYGINSFKTYLNFKTIKFYRQTAYIPAPVTTSGNASVHIIPDVVVVGMDSSFIASSTLLGHIKSFVYVLFGPFPWQIKNLRQGFALIEVIPWYLLLFFIFDGMMVLYKNKVKEAGPLLVFSFMLIAVIAVFEANFGIILRIRIPAFIFLLCIGSFGLNRDNILYNYINKFYEKILGYWRGWIYRFQHS